MVSSEKDLNSISIASRSTEVFQVDDQAPI